MGGQTSQIYPPTVKFTEKSFQTRQAKFETHHFHCIRLASTLFPNAKGSLTFLHLDLNDLLTVKQSAESFLSKEMRLNVSWNNADIMVPPQGSKMKQNHEAQLGINCLGPFLFTKLLTPVLASTAKSASRGSIRVVWLGSSAAEVFASKVGVDMRNLDYKEEKSAWYKYGVSKSGNILYSKEFATRSQADVILSVVCVNDFICGLARLRLLVTGFCSLNPGNLKM